MDNELTTPDTYLPNFDLKNPWIAATLILTVGACYCFTIAVNAKYNRDVKLSYGKLSLKVHSPTSVTALEVQS